MRYFKRITSNFHSVLLFGVITLSLISDVTCERKYNVTLAPWTHAVYNHGLYLRSKDSVHYRNISTSQDGEDVWAYENWFYGMDGGVILESGATDGLQISNTYMFEHFAGWHTIHIEPNEENFEKLVENRKSSINLNHALCDKEKTVHFLNKGVVSGIPESMDPVFMAIHHKAVFHKKIPLDSIHEVKCVPVVQVLQSIPVMHIDLWILDVEGAEENVLKGMDFNSVHVNTIIMECFGADREKETRKKAILENNNFICQKSSFDGKPVFLRKSWRKKRKDIEQEKAKATERNC
eukprot:gene3373-6673_t